MAVRDVVQAAAGVGFDTYWIALLGGSGLDIGYAVAVDSSKNIIVAGRTESDGAGGSDCLIAKYDSSGTLLWDKTLGGSGTDYFNGVTTDSSDNIIAVGPVASDGAGSYDCLIAKYDSSGTLVWDRTLGGSSEENAYGVTTDSSDNIIVAGRTESDGAGGRDCLIAKYDSSGTLLWNRTLGGSGTDIANGVVVDSSDDIIAVGSTTSDGAGGTDCLIAKYNSSGTLLWDRTLGGGGTDYFNDVAVDSFDNIIAVGPVNSDGAGGYDFLIAKYDSSGTLLWDRTLGGTDDEIAYSVTTDSFDNIIAVGRTSSIGVFGTECLIAKYDSSGTLLWDRILGGNSNDYAYSVTTDSSDNIIVAGYTASDGAGGNDAFVAKLPPDGSGTGTYGSLFYQDSVLTDAAAVLTDASAVLTDAAAVLTDAPAVLTDAVAVLTEEFFEITP